MAKTIEAESKAKPVMSDILADFKAKLEGMPSLDSIQKLLPVRESPLKIQDKDIEGYDLPDDDEDSAVSPLRSWGLIERREDKADEPDHKLLYVADLDGGMVLPEEPTGQFNEDEVVAGSDNAGIYLRDISKVKLLTRDQEVEYAKAMEAGKEAQETLMELETERQTAETAKERERLNNIIWEADDAKRKLSVANLRLVVSVARRYQGRGVELPDLIQEGNIGLDKAVLKFDYTKGFKFSTYATWWIRQAVTRAIADQARTIRIPVHMVDMIGKVYRASRDLLQIIGREPDVEEIANVMETNTERIRQIIMVARQPISLETPIGEEEDSTIGDLVADKNSDDPQKITEQYLTKVGVQSVLDELSERERRVLDLRFGLSDGRKRTLGEVGEELQVSRERVRQIEVEALTKLRKPELRMKLKEYTD